MPGRQVAFLQAYADGEKAVSASFKRPIILTDCATHYCPGCGHGIVHRIIAEIIEEQNLRERIIGMAPVGCAVLAYYYLDIDMSEAAHGRTPAVATGLKRANPDCIVFSYQGDGDLAAIGTAEMIHSANRGESISIIFINNAVYGMTGGQMAPTSLPGMKTTTTPRGRQVLQEGPPIRVCELLSGFERVAYLARTTLGTPKDILATKKAIARAFKTQEKGMGFSLVEILSPCPTYWKMTPVEAMRYVNGELADYFKPGVFKDWREDE